MEAWNTRYFIVSSEMGKSTNFDDLQDQDQITKKMIFKIKIRSLKKVIGYETIGAILKEIFCLKEEILFNVYQAEHNIWIYSIAFAKA